MTGPVQSGEAGRADTDLGGLKRAARNRRYPNSGWWGAGSGQWVSTSAQRARRMEHYSSRRRTLHRFWRASVIVAA